MIKSELWTDGPGLSGTGSLAGLEEPLSRRLPRVPVDAHEVLDRVLKECKSRITAKGLRVSVRLLSRQYHISDDGERLRQMYLNLLNNAVATAKAGSSITLRAYCPSDCALRIEIEERSAWKATVPTPVTDAPRKKPIPIRGHR